MCRVLASMAWSRREDFHTGPEGRLFRAADVGPGSPREADDVKNGGARQRAKKRLRLNPLLEQVNGQERGPASKEPFTKVERPLARPPATLGDALRRRRARPPEARPYYPPYSSSSRGGAARKKQKE